MPVVRMAVLTSLFRLRRRCHGHTSPRGGSRPRRRGPPHPRPTAAVSATSGPVVYLAAFFPKLSETFVYREVLGLRAAGLEVPVVALRSSTDGQGDELLDALRRRAIPLYGAGLTALIRDAVMELLTQPLRTAGTLALAGRDALNRSELRGLLTRLRVAFHAVAAVALARRLRPLCPVHLHAHMAHVPTTVVMYAARQLGIDFSFTGHADDLFRYRVMLAPKLRRAAFVHCISHWHRELYRGLVPRPDTDYPLVRCGVDPGAFPPRSEYDGPPRLLAVGRLVKKKGFDLLLAALAGPALGALPWTLRIIGEGPEETALHAQVESHPSRERITLMGAQPNAVVLRHMSQAEVFVLPCRIGPDGDRDGIPVVLMEAMAAGAAVIAGDLPAIRELVRQGSTGLLISPGDVPGLANALQRLCTDKTERDTIVDAARGMVEREFSLAVNIRRIVDNLHTRNLLPR